MTNVPGTPSLPNWASFATASDEIRYRSVTRKRLLTLTEGEQRPVLHELYEQNVNVLRHAILFCYQRSIRLYRISASLFPLPTHRSELKS